MPIDEQTSVGITSRASRCRVRCRVMDRGAQGEDNASADFPLSPLAHIKVRAARRQGRRAKKVSRENKGRRIMWIHAKCLDDVAVVVRRRGIF